MRAPNFLCIGAPKCGTTTLYEILQQHPQIFLSEFKEPHFFDNPANYAHGREWYLNTYFKAADQYQVVGEFTPSYLYEIAAHQRMKDCLGADIQLILLLRNPVDRAYSHYLHSKRDAFETASFEQALAHEEKVLQSLDLEKEYVKKLKYSYFSEGLYAHQLKALFRVFDKEQIRCYIFENDFIKHRSAMVVDILSFLNVDALPLDIDLQSNAASVARMKGLKQFMKKETWISRIAKVLVPSFERRQQIRNFIQERNNKVQKPMTLKSEERKRVYEQYFKDDIEKLEQLLDIDLTIWKE